jgi:hypothetical protein
VGRHWKPPKRQPETQNGRARLAAALQKHGFAWKKAWHIVRAIFAAMAEALLRGEDVETPIGTFETFYGPRERTRVRWGKTQTLFRNYKRVRFRPSPALQACLAPPAQQKCAPIDENEAKEGLPMSSGHTDGPLLKCPHCGGTSFTEQDFRQYREGIHSMPGGDISPASGHDAIKAYVCLCGNVRVAARRLDSVEAAVLRLAASIAIGHVTAKNICARRDVARTLAAPGRIRREGKRNLATSSLRSENPTSDFNSKLLPRDHFLAAVRLPAKNCGERGRRADNDIGLRLAPGADAVV